MYAKVHTIRIGETRAYDPSSNSLYKCSELDYSEENINYAKILSVFR